MSENTDTYDTPQGFQKYHEDLGIGRDLVQILVERELNGDGPFQYLSGASEAVDADKERIKRVRDEHPEVSEWFCVHKESGVDVTKAGHEFIRQHDYLEYPEPEDNDSGQQTLRGYRENTSVSNRAIKRADGGQER